MSETVPVNIPPTPAPAPNPPVEIVRTEISSGINWWYIGVAVVVVGVAIFIAYKKTSQANN